MLGLDKCFLFYWFCFCVCLNEELLIGFGLDVYGMFIFGYMLE